MKDLIERLEKLTEPSRGMDGRIAWALGWRFNGFIWDGDPEGGPDTEADFDDWPNIGGSWKKPGDDKFFGDNSLGKQELREGEAEGRWDHPPEWTGSIDAAAALVASLLPEWTAWEIKSRRAMTHFVAEVEISRLDDNNQEVYANGSSSTPAIALCIAILRAKEQS